MSPFKQKSTISLHDFDSLVCKTYGKVYCFQQQDGCKERGIHTFRVPMARPYDYENDTLPIKVNGDEMGVSFKSWLETKSIPGLPGWKADLFWERNFYPSLDMVVQDLYEKGLIPAGEHQIIIDW